MGNPNTNWPQRGHQLKHLIIHDENPDVTPNPDKRSLQQLIMSLSEDEFKRITQLLSKTPNLTPNEFRNFLLEEEGRQAALGMGPKARFQKSGTDKVAGEGEGQGKHCNNCRKNGHSDDKCWLLSPSRCNACGKVGHGEDKCWKAHPELAPIWYRLWPLKQNKSEGQGKSKGKPPKVCCLPAEDD